MSRFTQEFLSLLLQVAPYFAVGLGVAVLLRRLFSSVRWRPQWMSGLRGIAAATGLGAVLPGCCVAALPMAAGMRAAGATRGVVATFLLTSPLLSPQTFVLTWAVLGKGVALARVLATVVLLPLLGVGIEIWDLRRPAVVAGRTSPASALPMAPPEPAPSFWRQWWNLARETGPWLLFGLIIAALAAALMPEDSITRLLGDASGPMAYVAAAAIGVPAYICEGEEVPLAYGLLRLGLGAGPTLTFLLAAVGSCLPTLIVSTRLIGRALTALVAVFWFVFSILAGVLYEIAIG